MMFLGQGEEAKLGGVARKWFDEYHAYI